MSQEPDKAFGAVMPPIYQPLPMRALWGASGMNIVEHTIRLEQL